MENRLCLAATEAAGADCSLIGTHVERSPEAAGSKSCALGDVKGALTRYTEKHSTIANHLFYKAVIIRRGNKTELGTHFKTGIAQKHDFDMQKRNPSASL